MSDAQKEPIPVRIWKSGGEIMVSLNGLALLYGVPIDEIFLFADNITDPNADAALHVTDAMKQNAKRRTKEAFAHLGGENLWAAMRYWAIRDYSRDVHFTVEIPQ